MLSLTSEMCLDVPCGEAYPPHTVPQPNQGAGQPIQGRYDADI